MFRTITSLGAALLVAMTMVGGAAAQEPGPTWEPDVHVGQRVWITMTDGIEIDGRVLASSAEGVRLRTGGLERRVPLGQITRIEAHDPLTNGARSGAISGALSLGGWYALFVLSDPRETACGDHYVRRELANGLAFAALGAGLGALTGLALDAIILHRTPLYVAPIVTAPVPVGAPSRAGVGVALAWRWGA
jgi:hypothetical protein